MSNIVRPILLSTRYGISNIERVQGPEEEEVRKMSTLQILANTLNSERRRDSKKARCPENYCSHEDRVRN